MSEQAHRSPGHVIVAGAGMVGLATAWFLQERGIEVTVVDRDGVAAGSSWGNAGWLPPTLTTPLPEPAVLRYGVRALLSPSSPVYVPPSPDPLLLRFLTRFARHSTTRRWEQSMRVFAHMNRDALAAYDELRRGGVAEPTHEAAPFLVGLGGPEAAEEFRTELDRIAAAGAPTDVEEVTGEGARAAEPALGPGVHTAIRMGGQRYLNPGRFLHALAASVTDRGGSIRDGLEVTGVEDRGTDGVRVSTDGGDLHADAVVLATGTWLNRLARPFGVRQVVQAGRGYSFSVPMDTVPAGPVYFPDTRVACTPLGEGNLLRVAGMMEFRPPEAPLDQRRIAAIVDATRDRLAGAHWEQRSHEWVGSRPCTGDGLPLVGPTRSPRVHVAGGHGMWGIAWGPLTGRYVADSLVTGETPALLTAFDPLR